MSTLPTRIPFDALLYTTPSTRIPPVIQESSLDKELAGAVAKQKNLAAMSDELTDAQKQVLAGHSKPFPARADVRTWSLGHRTELLFSNNLVTIYMKVGTLFNQQPKELFALPKYALAAVSLIFAAYVLQQPGLDSFIINVGHMDKGLREEYQNALFTLERWVLSLPTDLILDLKAPTFYAELSLRHITRQLGMRFYLPERTEDFVRNAETHTLQPWQITELLYSSSLQKDAEWPVVMENDILLNYLAQRLKATTDSLWGEERDEVFNWLLKKDNDVLL